MNVVVKLGFNRKQDRRKPEILQNLASKSISVSGVQQNHGFEITGKINTAYDL